MSGEETFSKKVCKKDGKNRENLKVVDLFCGAGGLSLGFEREGFEILVASDYHKDACKTYRHNFPEVPCLKENIRDLKSEQLKEKGQFDEGDIDIVIGGPPCKGFSMAGERDPNDKRNTLFEEYLRIIGDIKPRAVLMENVKGLLSMQDGKYVKEIQKEFRDREYNVKYRVLNAADYGTPQLRERVIFLAWKDGMECSFPNPEYKPTKRGQKNLDSTKELNRYKTVAEAISDLDFLGPGESSKEYKKPPESNYQEEMRKNSSKLHNHKAPNHSDRIQKRFELLKEGKGMESLPKKYQTNKHSLQKLDRNKPASTITTLPEDFVHYSRNRVPTVREMARLQTFPDDFVFKGPRTTGGKRRRHSCPQYSQVGNAVPTLLSQALARELGEVLSR